MIFFNEDEIDALKEVVNVSYGMATSLITNAAGSHVALSVPEVSIEELKALHPILEKLPIDLTTSIITNQRFNGAYIGESILLVDNASAKEFAALMLDENPESLEDDDITSCALELSNILTSVSIGKLAEMLGGYMSFAAPILLETSIEEAVLEGHSGHCEQFFVVKTWLHGEEKNVVGYLLIFINETSFHKLKDTLDKFIEDYA